MKALLRPTIVRGRLIGFRCSDQEHQNITAFCEVNKMKISDFIRQCISIVEPSIIEKDITK